MRTSPRGRWPRARSFARKYHAARLDDAPPAYTAPEQIELDAERPRTRADCAGGPRPCPWVSCRHHLYLEVSAETGSIKLVRPDLEPDELEHSCSLDIADEGTHELRAVGDALNITRERVRQIEVEALIAMRRARAVRDAGGES